MTLGDFVELEIERLKDFKEHWARNNKINPTEWPLDMPAGDWHENLWDYDGN